MGVRDALVKFQAIIEGQHIMVITDHSALTWAQVFHNLNRRLQSWQATFSAFDIKIIHRAGRVHSNVNPLSRLERRIPFFDQPAYNEPSIDLSNSEDLDFYRRMKHKFDTRASSLAAITSHIWEEFQEKLPLLIFTIENPIMHKPIVLYGNNNPIITYVASTQISSVIHLDPQEIQNLVEGYHEDPIL